MKKILLIAFVIISINLYPQATFNKFGLVFGYPQNEMFKSSLVIGADLTVPVIGGWSWFKGHLTTSLNVSYLHTKAKYVKRDYFYKDYFGVNLELNIYPIAKRRFQPYFGAKYGSMLNFTNLNENHGTASIMPQIGFRFYIKRFVLSKERYDYLDNRLAIFLALRYCSIKEDLVDNVQFPRTNFFMISIGIDLTRVYLNDDKSIHLKL